MTWTYSGNPSASDLDAIRFMIGDTDTTDQLLQDAEVNYMITLHGMGNSAASECCRAIAAKFARLMNRSIGGLSADFSAKYVQYLELAESILRADGVLPVGLYASGWSISAKEAIELDTDRESTFARKGDMDNPRSEASSDFYPYDYRRN